MVRKVYNRPIVGKLSTAETIIMVGHCIDKLAWAVGAEQAAEYVRWVTGHMIQKWGN